MISQEQLPNTFLFQRLKWVNEKFFCIYDCWSDKTKKISGLLCEAVIGTFDTEWKITITTTKSLVAALLQALTAFKQRRSSVFFKCVWYGSDAGSLCTVPNHNKRARTIPSLLPTSLSVSFFTFLAESATSAVTHRPASQQVSVQLQYSHITTRQFFDGLHFPPFVSKGHGYLSAVDHSDQMTDTTSVLVHKNSLRGPSGCRALWPCSSVYSPCTRTQLHLCVNVCHQGPAIGSDRRSSVKRLCAAAADWGIYFSVMHNIGLELIDLSLLLLDYRHDECGEGSDILSEGGLSL